MDHGGGGGGGGLDVAGGEGEGFGKQGSYLREVENGGLAFDAEGGDVVGSSGHFRSGEGAEPDSRFLAGLADFGDPFAPISHSDAVVGGVSVSGSLASALFCAL